jgi:hypothetical protein
LAPEGAKVSVLHSPRGARAIATTTAEEDPGSAVLKAMPASFMGAEVKEVRRITPVKQSSFDAAETCPP